MKKIDKVRMQDALDERYAIWEDLQTKEDLLYYKGMIKAIELMGFSWDRKDGKHWIG